MSLFNTAREAWASVNENLSIEELSSALNEFISGDYSTADNDIDCFNRDLREDEPELTRSSWYHGIKDALQFLQSLEA